MDTNDNNDKDIMSELESIINQETSRINEPTDPKSEGLAIFGNLIKAINDDMPLVETQLFSIGVIDPDEVKQALKDDESRFVSNGSQAKFDGETHQGGKVELVTDSIKSSKILELLSDLESALVLSQWKEPAGLLVRAKRKGSIVQCMALGNVLIFEKVLPTGDRITKAWDTVKDSAPEADDFKSKWEFEFLQNLYLHLVRPQTLRTESPVMYEHILNMVKQNIAKAMMRGESHLLERDDEDDDE